MEGKVLQFTIDYLSYTVECPHHVIRHTSKTGVIEEVQIYEGRIAGTKINEKKSYLPIALQAALPPMLFAGTDETLGVTVNPDKYGKYRLSNYDTVYELETIDGDSLGLIAWHRTNVKQGIHVEMKGAHLETLRYLGYDLDIFLKQLIFMQNAKPSRMDLTIDIETEQKPCNLYSEVKNGTIRSEYLNPLTKLPMQRKTSYIEKDFGNEGSSIYFGSPASAQRAIVYDKGAERGSDENLLRVEMRARGEQSQEWARIAAGSTIQTAAVSFFRTFITGWTEAEQWLSEVPGNLKTTIPYQPRPGSRRWLQTVAGPAVLKALSEDSPYGADLRSKVLELIFGWDIIVRPKAKQPGSNEFAVNPNGVAFPYRVQSAPLDGFRFSQETIDKFFIQTPLGLQPKVKPL